MRNSKDSKARWGIYILFWIKEKEVEVRGFKNFAELEKMGGREDFDHRVFAMFLHLPH